MGMCQYCGRSAGLLSHIHTSCQQMHDATCHTMSQVALQTVAQHAEGTLPHEAVETLCDRLMNLARTGFVAPDDVRPTVVRAWQEVVDLATDDGPVAEPVVARLLYTAHLHGVTEPDAHLVQLKLAKYLDELSRGLVHARSPAGTPFNIQRGELLLWVFSPTQYYEDRVHHSYVGGSRGVTFRYRVAKGVYTSHHVGSHRGHPVETTTRDHIDDGQMGVTTKHIYFAGSHKSFRVPYAKIVSFIPYSDGFAIVRDAAGAKPQVFGVGAGIGTWLAWHMVHIVARW